MKFDGFPQPEQNYSRLPHAFIDALPLFESISELKVVLYILRHTWGFSEFDEPKHMTVDEIMNGRKKHNGERMDSGTGLSKPSVISGCRAAEEHGFIEVEVDDNDSARVKKFYRIRMAGSKSFTPEVKEFYPDVKDFDSSGQESLPRTEKETIERNSTEETEETAHSREENSSFSEKEILVSEENLEHWLAAYHQLEMQLDRASFDTWVRDAALLRVDEGAQTWYIGVRNQYACDMLQHRLYRNVRRVLADVTGIESLILQFEIHQPPEAENGTPLFKLLAEQELAEHPIYRERQKNQPRRYTARKGR